MPSMERSQPVRRIKTYSAATGFVYQYSFQRMEPRRQLLNSGTEYVYLVTADRKNHFSLRILVCRDAIERWGRRAGRSLTGAEEYAAAKMRLFEAFDEIEDLAAKQPELAVDDSNLAELLARLDIE